MSRYIYGHIWSKIPNIVELGQIYAWYLTQIVELGQIYAWYLTQIPGINLTQFNNIGNFRPNVAIYIPRHSTRACRAKNLFN